MRKIKIENALWEKYNAAFTKMENTLRSCKTEKHLRIISRWIDEVLTNYKEAETEGKSSRTREAVEDYIRKKTEAFNEIYVKMYSEWMKERENFKRYEKDWSDAKNGGKCPCC